MTAVMMFSVSKTPTFPQNPPKITLSKQEASGKDSLTVEAASRLARPRGTRGELMLAFDRASGFTACGRI